VGVTELDDQPGRRVIAHVDADAFYASVHLLEDPSLEGKPVIVAGTGPRSIVTTANYEARKFGIGSAQPASQARRLCPHGVFLRPDFELYRDYSRRASALMREVTDRIEPLSLDEAYLDVTDLDRPIAAMQALVARIKEETGLTYSVGIGPNKLCAKVLSDYRKPSAFNVASREQCCELFGGSSPKLIPGIGPKSLDALTRIGLDTIAAIREAPASTLAAAFGERRARELHDRSNFIHHGVVEASRVRKSISEERTFDIDIDDTEELQERLAVMARDLCTTLEQKGLRGRTIGIKVRHTDFSIATRAKTIPEYTDDPDLIGQVAAGLLAAYERPLPVRLIGVRVASFEHEASEVEAPRFEQLRLLDHAMAESIG